MLGEAGQLQQAGSGITLPTPQPWALPRVSLTGMLLLGPPVLRFTGATFSYFMSYLANP